MFLDDINLPYHYAALTVRSPVANRALKDIRCPPLEARYRLIRASDIPGRNRLSGSGVPVLASERLDYIGQPVAIIVGPDRLKLEEIVALITVETDDEGKNKDDETSGESSEKPPVFSFAAPDAEVIARIALSGEAFPKKQPVPKEKPSPAGEAAGGEREATDNIADREGAAVAEGAAAGEGVSAGGREPVFVTGSYRCGIQEHWYSEPHGAAASVTDEGVTVYAATQWPGHVMRSVAEALDMPVSAVSLETAETGLHFDGKIWYPSLVAVHAALAALITKKPVKLTLTRLEDFCFSPKRPETVIDFSTMLDPNGEPAETEINIRTGFGADCFFAYDMTEAMAWAVACQYRLGRMTVNACAVKTNLPPAGPFAGFGAAEGVFALERHAAKIADMSGIEGAEWRKCHYNEKRMPADETENLTAELASKCDYWRKRAAYELLRRSRETSGAEISPMRGIGLAVFAHLDGRLRYGFDDNGIACVAPRKTDAEARLTAPLAVAIIELEIDSVDFSAKIRGIWMAVQTGKQRDAGASRRGLIQNVICALGWTYSERFEYEEGRAEESRCFEYALPKTSAFPAVNIYFYERSGEDADTEAVNELPYCVIPAAYTQALTQAVGHHFESVPVNARDIWLALGGQKLEAEGEKKE
ncbi:MAG: molybdopterin-dependent oxidoreductase [Spirochaetaceae bacterium]|nr:molybdopterin-dependent oxidoreductase [Spirochaetaceae bacterium]